MFAQELIKFLEEPSSEIDFDMSEWAKEELCGTVGCIAGTAIFLNDPIRFKSLLHSYGDFTPENHNVYFVGKGAELLGIEMPVARHLFMPQIWVYDLHDGAYAWHYEKVWTHNYRADLNTIKKMVDWAGDWRGPDLVNSVTRQHAIEAIKQTAIDKEPYMDWQKVFENVSAKTN